MQLNADIQKIQNGTLFLKTLKLTTWEVLEPYFKDLLDRKIESQRRP